MTNPAVRLRILNPCANIEITPAIALSPRIKDLRGKRIGILNNAKNGAENILPFLEKALKNQCLASEIRIWKLHWAKDAELKEPVLKEIAQDSDAIIALMGD